MTTTDRVMEPKRSEKEYAEDIERAARRVINTMSERTAQEDVERLYAAFVFAKEAHKMQRRKSGAPYIIHPIAVAQIAAEELCLDANSVITAFLHDVVEDTEYTLDDIRERFGDDVATLVDVVTKKKKDSYKTSKQVDNYSQLLSSIHYDIRALMVKLADRLHNMRTLESMRPDKQMKIAGETDFFYAPLANRLGLFDVKTDLENLSFKYRCPMQYEEINGAISYDVMRNKERLDIFCTTIEESLKISGITARARVYYRRPYSIWRKMKAQDKDFKHIDNRYYVRITFPHTDLGLSEKETCLKIYSLLTGIYKEKPMSFVNQIDQAKENSYQSLNVMLLSEHGIWEDVQICSDRMVAASKLGCMASREELGVSKWIKRFRRVLEDIAQRGDTTRFMEGVETALYYDDIMVFTPRGESKILPKGATAIDFAFELHSEIGLHGKYARINGKLCSMKTELHRGDCIEIGTVDEVLASQDWLSHCCTYKAKRSIRNIIENNPSNYNICPHCNPLPGGETIGFKENDGRITIHRRSCKDAIYLASKYGDQIVAAELQDDPNTTYTVTVEIRAIDRYHLLLDIIDAITSGLHLYIMNLQFTSVDNIVTCPVSFLVHNVHELTDAIKRFYAVQGVDEVRVIE